MKDLIEDDPQQAVAAAITKIHIAFFQLTGGKPGWWQGTYYQFGGIIRNKGRVRMYVIKQGS